MADLKILVAGNVTNVKALFQRVATLRPPAKLRIPKAPTHTRFSHTSDGSSEGCAKYVMRGTLSAPLTYGASCASSAASVAG